MDLEKRVENLEKLVNGLIKTINNNNFYINADIAGCRQTTQIVAEEKADLSAISDSSETIGAPASKTYEKDETFTADGGQLYKASVKIWEGTKLIDGGNVEKTSVNDELKALKDNKEE